MSAIIQLKDVDFFYDRGKPAELQALKRVSLEIERGEFVSFFGPSGCGKSTLLYIIAGIEAPHGGEVLVNGSNLANFMPREVAMYRQMAIGLVFQSFNLIPSISVSENIMLPMAFLGINETRRKQRAQELLERFGITELAERLPFELSGGQQQRVAIARAIANDPPIVLADEPTGNLDSANATKTMELLREFSKTDGKTVILVSHETSNLKYADRVFYMRDGEITKTESAAEKEKQAAAAAAPIHYFKNLFPELPSVEIRAKALASMLLRGYAPQEIERMEHFLVKRFKNQIDAEVFMAVLDRSFADGGVGLWKKKAARVAEYVEDVIREEDEMLSLYKKLEADREAPLYDEIERICEWLVKDSKLKLDYIQIQRLHEVIEERIRNIITADHFMKVLDLAKARGGVGLTLRASFKIAERLETIMGHEVPGTPA